VAAMSTQIRFLGVAGYEITWADKRLLIDPFLSESPAAPIQPDELETPDLILVSHAACDHLGDTEIFGDMRLIAELYRPTIGLLGCAQPVELFAKVPGPGTFLTGEMSPREAALAAEFLNLEVAIACHYLVQHQADVQEFLRLVPKEDTSGGRIAIAPVVGAIVTISTTADAKTVSVMTPQESSVEH
jgi:L-ascorbate metabolism protein UlaG (beta-lactamase superfamily)